MPMRSPERPLRFADLVALYGDEMAWDLLVIIEKMAQLDPAQAAGNAETRLARALALITAQELEDIKRDVAGSG